MKVFRVLLRVVLNPWIIVLVIAAAGGAAFYLNAEDEGNQATNTVQQRREVSVTVVDVGTRTLREMVRGIGTLRATAVVDIRPEIAGRVRSINFEEGGPVSAHQVLFNLDDSKLQRQLSSREAALRSAQARLENAERRFRRITELRAQGATTADEYDQARTDLDAAESDVQELEADVEFVREQIRDTVLHAPFDGVISQKLVDPGSFVQVGEHLATVYRIDPLEISFHIPERYLGRVTLGQQVEIVVAAHPDTRFEGEVHFISPAVREATRDVLVRAKIDNPDGRLTPGAFATAQLIIDERVDRPVTPEEALVATRAGYMVYLVNDLISERRNVRTGLREGGMVEILEGLEPGDRIVRVGHMRLSGGERVRIVDENGNDVAEPSAVDESLEEGGS